MRSRASTSLVRSSNSPGSRADEVVGRDTLESVEVDLLHPGLRDETPHQVADRARMVVEVPPATVVGPVRGFRLAPAQRSEDSGSGGSTSGRSGHRKTPSATMSPDAGSTQKRETKRRTRASRRDSGTFRAWLMPLSWGKIGASPRKSADVLCLQRVPGLLEAAELTGRRSKGFDEIPARGPREAAWSRSRGGPWKMSKDLDNVRIS